MKSFVLGLKKSGSQPSSPKITPRETFDKKGRKKSNDDSFTGNRTGSVDSLGQSLDSSIRGDISKLILDTSFRSEGRPSSARDESIDQMLNKNNNPDIFVKRCPDVAYETPEDRLTKTPQYGKDLNKMLLNITEKEVSSEELMRTSSNRIHPTECLVEAVWMNNENLIKTILRDNRINTGAALLIAASEGHLNIVKMLINYQVYGNVKKSSRGEELKSSAREEKTMERRGSGIYGRRGPALRAAARNGRLNVVSYLLMMHADGVEGALIEAIDNQHYDVFNLLIEDKRYDSNRVLIESSKLGNLVAVKTMIDKGAENIDGALMAAAEKGHLPVVKYLIEEKSGFADGALSIAMENGHADIVLYLCRKNKTINV
jgi:hypothetical protein